MNAKPHAMVGDPAHEARDWFVRLLDSDVTAGEIEAWEAWMGLSPENSRSFNAVAEAWGLSGLLTLPRPSAAELAMDRYDGRQSVSAWRRAARPRLRLVSGWAGALAIAAAVTVGLVWWEKSGVQPVREIRTARAERKDAILSDGSEIKLGAQTLISVAYERKHRLVSLDRGEALFNVAKDEARPFIVRTGRGDITAVGTSFDVHVSSQRILLSVTEGAVNVRTTPDRPAGARSAGLVRVTAPQRLEISANGARMMPADIGPPFGPAWLEGRLEFRAQPLSVVLEDVNRYAPQPIVIDDPSVASLTYTGTVQLDSIPTWLQGLPSAFPLTVENRPGQFVLKRKKVSVGLPGALARSS
jgi:transmembrane sensor